MIRMTTNGVLKGYRTNLMKSSYTLNKARNQVLTQRNFNSYAEDPAAATQAFKLRRSWWRTKSQYDNNETVINRSNTAYSALDSVSQLTATTQTSASTALESTMMGANDTTGSGRPALGQQLKETAKSIVQVMNAQYGDTFVFSGADGLNVPFKWGSDGSILYRDVPVDCAQGSDEYAKLSEMEQEHLYVDLGLGLKEQAGELIESSAHDAALSGLTFLGYGEDEKGLPNNIASIIWQMGDCLSRCDTSTGAWDGDDQATFEALQGKLKDAFDHLTSERTKQSADTTFLKTNLSQLESTAYTLNEQFNSIEKCELADAITSFSWAQYCYNAALKVGNSILSQSLIDYMS